MSQPDQDVEKFVHYCEMEYGFTPRRKNEFYAGLTALLAKREQEVLDAIDTVLPHAKGHLVSSHSVIRRELEAAILAGGKE